MKKECKQCGNEIKNRNKLYCSMECYALSLHKDWAKITCLGCEKEFSVTPARKDVAKFCSSSCAATFNVGSGEKHPNWTGGKKKIICKKCKKIFYDYRSEAKYCSTDCMRVERYNQKCKACDKEFEIYPHQKDTIVLCSKDCRSLYFSKIRSGQNNHFWVDGRSYKKYPEEWTSLLRRSIRERDNYECKDCGFKQSDLKNTRYKKLDIHHKNGDKKNCSPENLITLCRGCHQERHKIQRTFNKLESLRVEIK
jgi:hypothetical protein